MQKLIMDKKHGIQELTQVLITETFYILTEFHLKKIIP
jgi:hypothetical protein